jgi:hypothetical protein
VQWGGTSASAGSWLAGRTEPPAADGWVPRQAWSSCDGSAVVVAGSSRDSAGSWSRFTRVWERQRNGEFRWVYTRSTPDPELTRARQERESAENEELGDDAILVEAANFIRARVADCTVPPPAASSDNSTQGVVGSEGLSRDRTLRWFWDASPSEPGRFVAHSWTGTDWEVVHAEPLGAAGE